MEIKGVLWFDMDGTMADRYGVKNWLPMLRAYDPTPYKIAKPLLNMSVLCRELNRVQRNGWLIGIKSWGSKCTTDEYDLAVERAKKWWLNKHTPSVSWDIISITRYGVPKLTGVRTPHDILFDDEDRHRNLWIESGRQAYTPAEILQVLRSL